MILLLHVGGDLGQFPFIHVAGACVAVVGVWTSRASRHGHLDARGVYLRAPLGARRAFRRSVLVVVLPVILVILVILHPPMPASSPSLDHDRRCRRGIR